MPSKKQTQPKKKKPFYKKSWPIVTIVLLVISLVAAFLVVNQSQAAYDETYRDRPLAVGLEYIGRDYNHPYVPFVGDVGPTTEIYYYATDTEPKDVVKLFPKWKIEEVKRERRGLQDDNVSDAYKYTLINETSGRRSAYTHIVDTSSVIKASKLKDSHRKYIIQIWRQEYDELRNKPAAY